MSPARKLFYLSLLIAVTIVSVGGNMLFVPCAHAQAGLSTGTIQGTILDPNGASVSNAKVTITSKGTGAVVTPEVTASGTYNSGPLVPGQYVVRVESSGFKAIEETMTVQVGNITPGNVTMEIGSESTVITVEGSAVSVDTEQTTIQGVVTTAQIENLPINGRNFLDLAQLEPGVQIQDGGNFDPTKKGFSSISFGGRFGRTARIEVDGLDISDETVGTTTQNVPVNSIKEFQVSQSSLDLSTELTSSGTVNITTISGTNTVHGEGFFNYRSDGTSAAIGNPAAQFNRKQYGVNLGGPLWKDKLFAFGSWERTTQDLIAAGAPIAPFDALTTTFNSPFRDQEYLGRLDYAVRNNIHAFFKFGYEQNLNAATFVPGTYQEFANVDFTPTYGAGVDITHGTWTHSFRVGYLKFRNGITDAVTGSSIFNPAPLLALAVGNVSTSCTAGGDLFCSGPNILAPQKTYQSNKQFKYDGTKSFSTHIIRYGAGVNRILGGGFASFFGIAPAVRASVSPAND
ncbi:MAG TPA: carboxypeptidase regulatory-like domain-containing protein, partial [Methylomirabilota bacterium]|nr:carboxypeptidase regulatory-like domain-containing protein [Methylomirabilota bacterium]